MSQYFEVHPTHPQTRLIRQAAEILRRGGVIAYPTDSTYAFACHLGDKAALDRVRALRALDRRHLLTLMCRDLSVIATYARVDNTQYRALRHRTPGPFTFVLQATREVPKRLLRTAAKPSACGFQITLLCRPCSKSWANRCYPQVRSWQGSSHPLPMARIFANHYKKSWIWSLTAAPAGLNPQRWSI